MTADRGSVALAQTKPVWTSSSFLYITINLTTKMNHRASENDSEQGSVYGIYYFIRTQTTQSRRHIYSVKLSISEESYFFFSGTTVIENRPILKTKKINLVNRLSPLLA